MKVRELIARLEEYGIDQDAEVRISDNDGRHFPIAGFAYSTSIGGTHMVDLYAEKE